MCKGKRPETQVGGSVGHCGEDILDGVDALVDHGLPKGKLLIVVAVASRGGRHFLLWLGTEAKLLGQLNVLGILLTLQWCLHFNIFFF